MRLDDVLGYMNPEVHMPNTVSLGRWLSSSPDPAAVLELVAALIPAGNRPHRAAHVPQHCCPMCHCASGQQAPEQAHLLMGAVGWPH